MLCTAYAQYCKFYKMTWEKPIYTPDEVGIQPPTDEQVKTLFSGVKNPLSLKVQISAETGLRPIEVQVEKGLQVKHVHIDQRTITAVSTKRCYPRPPMNITEELTTRLRTYMTINKLQSEDQLFHGEPERYGEHSRRARNKLADKLGNPELRKIRLYDLRHYYVTKQLRKLQNTEFVRQKVGHKNLNTTQKYMHLLAGTSGEWIVEGTTDKERAKQLLASDFIYQLTTPDGTMLFRKPK
jgi:integrase